MEMEKKGFVTIDGIPVEINDEKNLLELIRKAGIKMPTFCYHSELSIYGACRMCMVENQRGGLDAACSTVPKDGMVIRTNTERLRKYRKMILELILANHCRDCTTCPTNTHCKLQAFAVRYNLSDVRFPNTAPTPKIDDSSLSIIRDQNKCILCGDCVRVCNEVQNVGAIDFAHRGSNMTISTPFEIPIAESACVGCGQCAIACPTGAILVKNDTQKVWEALDDENVTVSVQIAPAVRVAIGRGLKVPEGENAMGKLVATLRRMGFDEIYDTAMSADLTIMEETAEFAEHLEQNREYPLFTSCCPGWIQFCEKKYPEFIPYLSTAKSPMQMFSALLKEYHKNDTKKHVHVAIMPCTAKKFEAARDEFKTYGTPDVDVVLTTQEIIHMIKESCIAFEEVEPEAVDMPFGISSGAGVIFGVTGGVMEAALRKVVADKSRTALFQISQIGVRGQEGIKEFSVPYGDRELRIAVVSGLGNTSILLDRIKAGEHFDFVEVMACPGGCINGGGQPFTFTSSREKRANGLYTADKMNNIRRSEENPIVADLYKNGILKDRAHELLHVHYGTKHNH